MSAFERVILVADSNFAVCLYFEDLRPWLTITLKLVFGMVAVVVFATHVQVLNIGICSGIVVDNFEIVVMIARFHMCCP